MERRARVQALKGRSEYELGQMCSAILERHGAVVDWEARRCMWCGELIDEDAPNTRRFCRDACIMAKQRAMVRAVCEHPAWERARDAYGEFERCKRCGLERADDDAMMTIDVA